MTVPLSISASSIWEFPSLYAHASTYYCKCFYFSHSFSHSGKTARYFKRLNCLASFLHPKNPSPLEWQQRYFSYFPTFTGTMFQTQWTAWLLSLIGQKNPQSPITEPTSLPSFPTRQTLLLAVKWGAFCNQKVYRWPGAGETVWISQLQPPEMIGKARHWLYCIPQPRVTHWKHTQPQVLFCG